MSTGKEAAQIEGVIRQILSSRRGRKDALLPLLLEIQRAVGFIPQEAIPEIGRSVGYTGPELLGVITYYRHLRLSPPAKRTLHVCRGTPCHLAGSKGILADLPRQLGIPVGGKSSDGGVQLEESACLGLCHAAPAGMVGEEPLPRATVEGAAASLIEAPSGLPQEAIHVHVGSVGSLLRSCAEGPILSLDDYVSHGGLAGLQHALKMPAGEVISLVEASGLCGRGGAGFPTGAKWRAVSRQTETPKYLICNADESEPGTFKDRFLLANNPFAILEGMAIAAYAIGAQEAYLFIRFEYKNEFDLLSRCIKEAEEAGWLADGRGVIHHARIRGGGAMNCAPTFKVHPFRSAGGYICGEETALIEAIEGKRGEPRLRPPYPTLRGLWGQPTAINNVETLANIPLIVAAGPEKFASSGTEKRKGTKLFCLSGDVGAPGLYEAPLGIPLGELLRMAEPGRPKAVLLGGAAGRLIPASQADLALDFENGAANGAIIVLNESRCVVDVCLNLMEFFARECCGLCLVGREGTTWALTLLRQAAAGEGSSQSLEALKDVAQTLSLASRCGLGQTAANGIVGALRHFPEEVESHFVRQRCPLGVCGREGESS